MATEAKTFSTEAKRTPGPWHVSPPTRQNPSQARVTALSGGVDIYDAPLTTETEANAHLIAAAPDMLAALKEADRTICSALDAAGFDELYPNKQDREKAHSEHLVIKKIRAAISKAEGQ